MVSIVTVLRTNHETSKGNDHFRAKSMSDSTYTHLRPKTFQTYIIIGCLLSAKNIGIQNLRFLMMLFKDNSGLVNPLSLVLICNWRM